MQYYVKLYNFHVCITKSYIVLFFKYFSVSFYNFGNMNELFLLLFLSATPLHPLQFEIPIRCALLRGEQELDYTWIDLGRCCMAMIGKFS